MGGKAVRRLVTGGVATVAAFALAVAPASAHFCFRTQLSERAQEASNKSPAFISFGELAFEFTGLCDEGIQILADAGGVTTGTLIHTKTVMAGGTLKKADGGGTPGISHLDFEAIDAAFPAAEEACA
jgi:hypothetical protein